MQLIFTEKRDKMRAMKKRWKQLCALICAVSMLLLPACSEENGMFRDVPENEWYTEAVAFLTERGILNGFEDGTFRPAEPLTKAQLTKLLLAGEVSGPGPENDWWRPYYLAAQEAGILSESDEADMDRPIDRYRTAQMLAASLLRSEAETVSMVDGKQVTSLLSDLNEIPEQCLEAVVTVYGLGILRGYDDGCFHGAETLTRAQGAAIIQRCLQPDKRTPVIKENPGPITLSDVLFLGNSLCEGLGFYGETEEPDFLSSNGAGVYSAGQVRFTDRSGNRWYLSERLSMKSYRIIVLVFGTNEMGFDMDYVREQYGAFLDMLTEAQPDAELWLVNAPPVNEELLNSEAFTNRICGKVNRIIADLCEERDLQLIDLHSHVADWSGSLPEWKTLDGIHFTGETYRECLNWMIGQLPVEQANTNP